MSSQPWFRLSTFLSSWRPDLDLEAWCSHARLLGAAPTGYERQLDAASHLCPANMDHGQWEMLIDEQLRQTARSGPAWEELLASWVALHSLMAQHHAAAISRAAADAATGGEGGSSLVTKHSGGQMSWSDVSSEGQLSEGGGVEEMVGVPGGVPRLDVFLRELFVLEADPEAQLDLLTSYKPRRVPLAEWERDVKTVSRREKETLQWSNLCMLACSCLMSVASSQRVSGLRSCCQHPTL